MYYIGAFPVQNQETLKFTIEVTPEGASQAIKVKTSQQYFTKSPCRRPGCSRPMPELQHQS